MSPAEFAGWVGTVTVLVSYVVATRTDDQRWFHWGNVAGFPLICWSAAAVGAWPNMVLTLTFGAIAVWGLVRSRTDPFEKELLEHLRRPIDRESTTSPVPLIWHPPSDVDCPDELEHP